VEKMIEHGLARAMNEIVAELTMNDPIELDLLRAIGPLMNQKNATVVVHVFKPSAEGPKTTVKVINGRDNVVLRWRRTTGRVRDPFAVVSVITLENDVTKVRETLFSRNENGWVAEKAEPEDVLLPREK
jgi:hypothetical protein